MKHLKPFKIFENVQFSDEEILEELKLWDIEYKWNDNIKFLEISFRYPDRIDNLEIDTINKVISKLDKINYLRIFSSKVNITVTDLYDYKPIMREEQLKGLKIPNGCKVITGFYNIMVKYFPEIDNYFNNLFNGLELKERSDEYKNNNFYVKNGKTYFVERLMDNIIFCNYAETFGFFNKYLITDGEKSEIMKDIIFKHLNIITRPVAEPSIDSYWWMNLKWN